VQKEQVSLSLSKDLIKLVDSRRGRASRSAEVEYLIRLGLEHDNDTEDEGSGEVEARGSSLSRS
jgi:metal-responsive CopG/Arc/MetJ family transcriptional regulator